MTGHLPGRLALDRAEVTDPRFAQLNADIAADAAETAAVAVRARAARSIRSIKEPVPVTPHQAATTPLPPLPDQRHTPGRGDGEHPARRRRGKAAAARLPEAVRDEVTKHGRLLARHYRADFEADPKLRDLASRLFRRELPPKPRHPGHPQEPSVNAAIRLDKQFQRQLPNESPQKRWKRIAQEAIPGYGDLLPYRQSEERTTLRKRVQACERQRRRRRRAE